MRSISYYKKAMVIFPNWWQGCYVVLLYSMIHFLLVPVFL